MLVYQRVLKILGFQYYLHHVLILRSASRCWWIFGNNSMAIPCHSYHAGSFRKAMPLPFSETIQLAVDRTMESARLLNEFMSHMRGPGIPCILHFQHAKTKPILKAGLKTMGIVGPCFSCAKEHSGINSHGRNQDFQHWILSLFSRCCAIDPIRRRHDGRSMLFFQPARSENDQNGTTIEVRIKSPGCWFQPLAWILTLLSGINCLVSIV